MSARPRRPAGRFLAPNGRTRTKPLRELPQVADEPEQVDRIREARRFADEPEGIGPAILTSYAEVNRRIMSQQIVLEVAAAQDRRPELSPQNRLDTVHQRAKHAHVDMSHPIHLVQKAIDKARLREQPIAPAALVRLEGLEALLDGVSIQRLAA
jgi:hypothetical protein